MAEKRGKLWIILLVLGTLSFAFLFFIILIAALFGSAVPSGNVAVIPIKGVITVDRTSTFTSDLVSSTEITEFIKQAEEDSSIQAIIFDINSPGGSAVASKEIVDAVKASTKPTYAVIREMGASGAYWVASATDFIIADELSITGSIGVISSYIEFAGLLQRYNMTYQRLTAGKYKDLGDPFRQLNLDEKELLLKKLNKIHEYFIQDVASNRNIPLEEIKKAATGEFYLGEEALTLKLIDSFGNIEAAKEKIKHDLNLAEIELAEYKKPESFLESLSEVFSEQSFKIGEGIGSAMLNQPSSKLKIFT